MNEDPTTADLETSSIRHEGRFPVSREPAAFRGLRSALGPVALLHGHERSEHEHASAPSGTCNSDSFLRRRSCLSPLHLAACRERAGGPRAPRTAVRLVVSTTVSGGGCGGGGAAAVTPGVPEGQRLSSAQRRCLFPGSHQGLRGTTPTPRNDLFSLHHG